MKRPRHGSLGSFCHSGLSFDSRTALWSGTQLRWTAEQTYDKRQTHPEILACLALAARSAGEAPNNDGRQTIFQNPPSRAGILARFLARFAICKKDAPLCAPALTGWAPISRRSNSNRKLYATIPPCDPNVGPKDRASLNIETY